ITGLSPFIVVVSLIKWVRTAPFTAVIGFHPRSHGIERFIITALGKKNASICQRFLGINF
ncbi:hypothetical protein QT806_24030, partial [Xanthomonas citri pv. citri]